MVNDGNEYIMTESGDVIEIPAMILDVEDGVLLKIGDLSWVGEYYVTMLQAYRAIGKNMDDSIKLLFFNEYNDGYVIPNGGKLIYSAGEIVTLVNYLSNNIGKDKMLELLHLKEPFLKQRIEQLHDLGF